VVAGAPTFTGASVMMSARGFGEVVGERLEGNRNAAFGGKADMGRRWVNVPF